MGGSSNAPTAEATALLWLSGTILSRARHAATRGEGVQSKVEAAAIGMDESSLGPGDGRASGEEMIRVRAAERSGPRATSARVRGVARQHEVRGQRKDQGGTFDRGKRTRPQTRIFRTRRRRGDVGWVDECGRSGWRRRGREGERGRGRGGEGEEKEGEERRRRWRAEGKEKEEERMMIPGWTRGFGINVGLEVRGSISVSLEIEGRLPLAFLWLR